MKHRLLPILIVGAVAPFALVDAASAATVHGTVIKREAGANVVALASGKLVTVRGSHARVGSVITVRGVRSGSTITAKGVRVTGRARHAKIHGIVMRRAGHRFLLADRGAAVAVTSTQPPATGSEVTTAVTISSGSLEEDGAAEVDDAQADGAEFSGTIGALPATGVTPQVLSIVVNGVTVPVQVGTFPLPVGLAVGQRVEVEVSLSQPTPGAIVFTLLRIHAQGVDGSEGDHQHGNCSNVKATGALTLAADGKTLTVTADGMSVTFTVPTGFPLNGLVDGALVEAKGTKNADGSITLVSIQAADGSNCRHGHDGQDGQDDDGSDDDAAHKD